MLVKGYNIPLLHLNIIKNQETQHLTGQNLSTAHEAKSVLSIALQSTW